MTKAVVSTGDASRSGSSAIRAGFQLQRMVGDLIASRKPRDAGLALFGVGQAQVVANLTGLERRTQRSVWGIHPNMSFDPEDPALDLDARSLARGIDVRTIVTERASRFHPLLSSVSPNTRVGAAPCQFILVDHHLAVVAGPCTPSGATVAWLAKPGPVLSLVVECWEASWAEGRPLLAKGEEPPANQRQVHVARHMCLGRTDEAISRSLGISPRTVARDIAKIMELTDAHSRTAAVLVLLGRGRHTQ